jgi:hypothetical protein
MSRLNRKDNSTYGNTNTHIFTEFSTFTKETTQKELLEAIKDNSSIKITDTNNDNTLAINNDGSINVVSGESSGDIVSNILLSQGAPIYADTTPIPFASSIALDNKGWVYSNTLTGNNMNLYYFNGVGENKQLDQITGQYAVITNLTTISSNNLIFTVYTQGTLNVWYQSRVTRSSSNNKLIGGGKYLVYWGNIPSNIYPQLERIEMDSTTTNGPALSTELILTIGLNTNSATPAGQATYLIESLGAIISASSRVLNLLIDSEYSYIKDTYATLVNLNSKINNTNEDYPLAIDVNVVSGGGGGGGGGLTQNQFYDGADWVNASSNINGVLNTYDETNDVNLGYINNKLPTGLTTYNSRLFVDTGADINSSGGVNSLKVYNVDKSSQIQGNSGTAYVDLKCSSGGVLETTSTATTSLDTKINNADAPYADAIKVFTVNSGGGGGSSTIVQGVPVDSPTTPSNINIGVYSDGTYTHNTLECKSNLHALNYSTGQYEGLTFSYNQGLNTASYINDCVGNGITSQLVGSAQCLDVIPSAPPILGGMGNIANGITLTAGSFSTGFNINQLYSNNSVLIYNDATTASSGGIVVQISNDDINYFSITILYPVVMESGKRVASSILNIRPFAYIRLLNNSGSSYSNINCGIFSS